MINKTTLGPWSFAVFVGGRLPDGWTAPRGKPPKQKRATAPGDGKKRWTTAELHDLRTVQRAGYDRLVAMLKEEPEFVPDDDENEEGGSEESSETVESSDEDSAEASEVEPEPPAKRRRVAVR